MSKFSAKGLSILAKMPLIQGDEVIGNYTSDVNDYSHTISANGGFVSADFTIAGNNEFLENWLQFGLGRHIQVFDPTLDTIWEGYVNEITANMGSATFSRGPLSAIGNRVVAWYTPKYKLCLDVGDPLYDPNCVEAGEPLTGTQMPTPLVEDLASQQKYGIWEKILTIGDAYREDAEYIRDLYLVENANPEWNPSLSIADNQGELSVKISCRGYIDWLSYVYTDADPNISVLCSELIKTILTADPNDVISNNYVRIAENLRTYGSQFLDEKLAKTIIDDILTLGGGSDERWTFGIYKDRKAIYEPIPTSLEYIYYKTGKVQQVETLSGTVVEPWNVLPCKWVGIPTFLTSFPWSSDLQVDPRIFFAEEVTFTAPDQVNITGAKIRKLPQFLASLGLGGV